MVNGVTAYPHGYGELYLAKCTRIVVEIVPKKSSTLGAPNVLFALATYCFSSENMDMTMSFFFTWLALYEGCCC